MNTSVGRRNFIRTSLAFLAAATAPPYLAGQDGRAGGLSRALFFTPGRIAGLKRKLEGDPVLRERWTRLLERARELALVRLPAPDQETLGAGVNPGGPSAARLIMDMAFVLGLAWRVTGDARYAKALRSAVLQVTEYTHWTTPGIVGRTPPWRSDLWSAAFTLGTAVGLEALGDNLTASERGRIAGRMVTLGIEPLLADWVVPSTRIHTLDSMGHNWWSVCISGAGIGCLALMGEDDRARGWVREVDSALKGFFEYRGQVLFNKPVNFDRAGAFHEGVHYADYAISEYLLYRLARSNALPGESQPRIPVLERAAEFFVHASYPASGGDLALDFGDSRNDASGVRAMRLLAAHGYSPQLTRWYLRRDDKAMADPLSLLYIDPDVTEARNDLPGSVMYSDIGWAMLRNSWAEDATLLAVRCGHTWNHAHADAGSFILWHAGRPLLIDSGTCAYARKEYTGYYRQSRAHNVVLFDGQGQATEDFHERGGKFRGHLHELIDGLGVRYLYADATGPMAQHFTRNYRHWLWLGEVILVFDDILAHKPGRFEWLLHYAGKAKRDGAAVAIVNGPASARVVMLHPANPQVREMTGLAPNEPDVPVKFFALTPPVEAREQKFIVAILPTPVESTVRPPQVELLNAPGVLGVRVRNAAEITDVYFNLEADGRRMHVNSNLTIAGWETDAYLLALTRPAAEGAASTIDSVTRYVVSAASYLRREGQTVLASLSKVTAAFQPGAEAEVLIHGQPQLDVQVLGLVPVKSLKVNGTTMPCEYSAETRTIRFQTER